MSKTEYERFRLRAGDVVITKDSEDRHDIAKPVMIDVDADNLVCGYHLAILRPKAGRIMPEVLASALRIHEVRHEFGVRCNGVTRFGLGLNELKQVRVPCPPKQWQLLACAVASSHHDRSKLLDNLIALKRCRFSGLMHQLLTGRRRLPAFADQPWDEAKAGGLFRNRREVGKSGLPVISVTMHDGLVPRDAIDRKVSDGLAPSDHLLVKRGDLVYNMMRMWQGASGLANYDGIVSPAYIVLAPTSRIDSQFASYWFKSSRMIYLFWAYSYGITGDRLRLYYKDFAMIPVALPRSLDEQRAIADVLDTAQKEIDLLVALREQVQRQKRGLMQQLLTGKLRIPTGVADG